MAMKATYLTVDGEVISESRNGVRKDYVPDPLGSTVALLDSSQNQTDTFTYWPYGEERTRTGTTPTPFTYVGTLGYYRDKSNRSYVRARELEHELGRWMQVDPLWPILSAYTYVGLHPTTFSDPAGRQVLRKPWPPRNQFGPPYKGKPELGPETGRKCRSGFDLEHNALQLLLCSYCIRQHKIEERAQDGGENDKQMHCIAGCLANIFCGTPCSARLGIIKETIDKIGEGTVGEEDAVATDDGWDFGEKYPDGLNPDKYCAWRCRRIWK